MAYNSLFLNLYAAGLYETFCFINPKDYILFDLMFYKNGQLTMLTMENL